MTLRGFFIPLTLVFLSGCFMSYKQAVFETSPGAKLEFQGVVDQLQQDRPLDVLLVHGMCTHNKEWANAAVASVYDAMGGGSTKVDLQLTAVPGTKVELYQQTLQTRFGKLRANAVVWTPLTTPLKKQLCYDQSDRSATCTSTDAPEPYPYKRATLNKLLKDSILNDCLSDAMAYQGQARDEISGQIQSAIMQALATSGASSAAVDKASLVRGLEGAASEQLPLVILTESLGSKIAFDAIFKLTRSGDSESRAAANRTFDRITQIFMAANQLPILSLADQQLDGTMRTSRGADDFPEDSLGSLLRARGVRVMGGPAPTIPSVVAFSDPNDLLSYPLARSPHRSKQDYPVIDVIASNAPTILGLVEMPTTAHLGYGNNGAVKKIIACGHPESKRCLR